MISRKIALMLLLLLAFRGLASCKDDRADHKQKRPVLLATTTSTYDTGLLDALTPDFERVCGCKLKTVAVGTGRALAMGRKGEADVLLVHAPAAEEKFMKGGHGSSRKRVMHNDFVLVGPPDDPAQVAKSKSVDDALRRIVTAKATFVSRGDNSGTHKKEKALWRKAGVSPDKRNLLEAGQGMSATLRLAAEKKAYTLTDRGTYLALRKGLSLKILRQGDASLLNIYHVIVISQARHSKVNRRGAEVFARFLASEGVQRRLLTFGKKKFGQPLFFPDLLADDARKHKSAGKK